MDVVDFWYGGRLHVVYAWCKIWLGLVGVCCDARCCRASSAYFPARKVIAKVSADEQCKACEVLWFCMVHGA